MSLIRQIWLLLLCVVGLALLASVGVTLQAARETLQTQLRLKNSDNAATLALALSQQQGDAARMELLLAAQFDTGFYREIRWVGADGQTSFERRAPAANGQAPAWFVRWAGIDAPRGQAQVSDGWRALGAVQVSSQAAYAHDALWQATLRSAGLLLLVALAAGALATLGVRRIGRSVDQVVGQARALIAGRFESIEEPRTPELRRLARAMNAMVSRLKLVFDAQATQVETLRQRANCDPLTGVANRQHFLAQLTADLAGEAGHASAGLVLVRLRDLADLNRSIGHAATDRLVVGVAQALSAYSEQVRGSLIGRLNGSDFAVCLPVGGVAEETAQALASALKLLMPSFAAQATAAIGAVEVDRRESPSVDLTHLLGAADAALALAESRGPFAVEAAIRPRPFEDVAARGEGAWRQHIAEALSHPDRARLVEYPIIDAHGRLLHLECPLRLRLDRDGDFEPAAYWLPLALRGRMTALADERAVALAIKAIARDGVARSVNLSVASLADPGLAARLRERLQELPRVARHLWLEVPEIAAVEHFALMQELGRQLRPVGVRFGLEHAGERLHQIDPLYEAGLDYVKLDAAIVMGVGEDPGRAAFVKGLAAMLHGLALQVYAEGVRDERDAQALWAAGVDGLTGPWASGQAPMR
jgi:diguanylate cyclase (GGDEF)-like protein